MGDSVQQVLISETGTSAIAYEAPSLVEIGALHEITLGRGQRCF